MSDQGGGPEQEAPLGADAEAMDAGAAHGASGPEAAGDGAVPTAGAPAAAGGDGIPTTGAPDVAMAPPPPPPPPPPPAPPLASAEAPRRRSRRPLIAAAVAVVVAAGAIAAVAARGGDELSADEALDRAQAALDDVDTFRMHSVSEDRSTTGEAGGAGSSTIYRSVTDIDVAGEASHSTYDSGDWADEMVVLADELYTRSAESLDELAAEPWQVVPNDGTEPGLPVGDDPRSQFLAFIGLDFDADGEIDSDFVIDEYTESMVVPGLAGYYLFGLGAPLDPMAVVPVDLPGGLIDTFGSFADAEIVSDAGDELVIAATRTVPPELAEGIEFDLPPGRFEITLGPDDLPTALELTVEGTNAHYIESVEFSDWGADIAVGEPEGEIDETPWLDEEALAEVRSAVEAVAPTVVPDGLVLSAIEALSAEDAEAYGNEPCGQLILSYMPPTTDVDEIDDWYMDGNYLDVYLLPQSCALAYDDTPFEAGEYGDVPSRQTDIYVEALVGETVVQFDTSYLDDLPAMVASIQPFDLDAELARVGPLAEQQIQGGWYPVSGAGVSEMLEVTSG